MEPVSSWIDLEYAVGAADRICRVSESWDRVAREAGAPHLDEVRVVGTRLWSHVTERTTQHVWQVVVEQVRVSGRARSVPIRCDTPSLRRWIRVDVSAAGDEVVFRTRLERVEERERVDLLDAAIPRSPRPPIRMCGWCKRVALPDGRWVEVEDAGEPLGLLGPDPPPAITHGICATCSDSIASGL